jgi:hypothetical protein
MQSPTPQNPRLQPPFLFPFHLKTPLPNRTARRETIPPLLIENVRSWTREPTDSRPKRTILS